MLMNNGIILAFGKIIMNKHSKILSYLFLGTLWVFQLNAVVAFHYSNDDQFYFPTSKESLIDELGYENQQFIDVDGERPFDKSPYEFEEGKEESEEDHKFHVSFLRFTSIDSYKQPISGPYQVPVVFALQPKRYLLFNRLKIDC